MMANRILTRLSLICDENSFFSAMKRMDKITFFPWDRRACLAGRPWRKRISLPMNLPARIHIGKRHLQEQPSGAKVAWFGQATLVGGYST
jgi:hypothetical protein